MKIQKDFKNKLLKRREIVAVIEEQKNPGFDKVIGELVNELKVDKELVAINKLDSRFGRNEFVIDAFVYDSIEDKNKIETKKIKKEKQAGAQAVKLEEKQEEKK